MRTIESLGSADIFWSEIPEVVRTMSQVRRRKISIVEGAFHLGVAVADLTDRVGPLDPLPPPPPPPEVKKSATVAKPKPNLLEKMCRDDGDMSEYDRIRQRNIQERLALFNKVIIQWESE